MKKKGILFALCGFTIIAIASDSIVIPSFCERYHERSYLLIRLEKSVHILKLHEQLLKTECLNEERYHNPAIKQCIRNIKKMSSLTPLLKEWEKTTAYKYLNDKTYGIDLARLIFTLQNHMLSVKSNIKENIEKSLILHGKTYTEATTIRNYYSKRIKKTISLLRHLKCTNGDLFEEPKEGCNCALIYHNSFIDPQVIKCLKQVESSATLHPLFSLFNDFSCCRFPQNDRFIQEFVWLIFITLRNVTMNNAVHKNVLLKRDTLELINYIYSNLENVSVEEILDAIDILTEELPSLLEKYQFFSNMSWKSWLKKYWWVPPSLGTILGLRLYWKHLHPHDTLRPNALLAKSHDEQ